MNLKVIKSIVEGVTDVELSDTSRVRRIATARFLYFAACRQYTTYSTSAIGKEVNRDHSTVLHGLKVARDLMSYDKSIVKQYDQICQLIEYSIKKNVTDDSVSVGAIIQENIELREKLKQSIQDNFDILREYQDLRAWHKRYVNKNYGSEEAYQLQKSNA